MIEPLAAHETFIKELIGQALKEDIRSGDVTTNAIVSEHVQAEAVWVAKGKGVVSGVEVARQVFKSLDNEIKWKANFREGEEVAPGSIVVEMQGSCRSILTAERTALNIVQRMSGIATKTRRYVEALKEHSTEILDTRKTAPGLRFLDKRAVKAGGGTNHRMGLYDLAMIKDNHIKAAGSITEAVNTVRSRSNPSIKIEVETSSLKEVEEAVAVGADIIMLDNMNVETMKQAVSMIGRQAKTEASGNITFKNLQEVAQTGVSFISSGALTHSVTAFDISQQLEKIVK